MDRKKQEEEVYQYVLHDLAITHINPMHKGFVRNIVKAIMARYDLFDIEDMPKGE